MPKWKHCFYHYKTLKQSMAIRCLRIHHDAVLEYIRSIYLILNDRCYVSKALSPFQSVRNIETYTLM